MLIISYKLLSSAGAIHEKFNSIYIKKRKPEFYNSGFFCLLSVFTRNEAISLGASPIVSKVASFLAMTKLCINLSLLLIKIIMIYIFPNFWR
jgi:hypothetical protein